MKSFASFTRSSILLLAAVIPFLALYVSGELFFPFITGKGFAFRTLVELMLVLYIPLAVAMPEYRPQKSIPLVLYGIFIVILFCADMLGVNPSNSLWSNFERMEGFVTHIHLFALTLILLSLRLTEIEWKRVLQIQLVAGVCVLLASLGEYASINAKIAAGQEVGRRLAATLGNPAYLAIYSAFNIGIAGILLLKSKAKGYVLQTVYGIIALLHLFVLWQTQTRGTILGLVAGAGVGILWYLFLPIWKKEKKYIIYLVSSAIAIIIISFVLSLPIIIPIAVLGLGITATILATIIYILKNKTTKSYKVVAGIFFLGILTISLFLLSKETPFVQNNPTLKRLAAIELGEQTVRSRLMIWNMSLEGVKERPLLGWGQDNFVYVFAKHYNPEMFDQEQWFDRSHNVFFDWLIAAGVLGLLAYLSLYGVSAYSIITNKQGRFSDTEQALLLGILVTYFVHNTIVFDNLISYISFFALFAYINAHIITAKIEYGKRKVTGIVYAAVVLVVVGMSTIFYNVVYKPYVLNTSIIRMFSMGQGKTIEQVKDIATQMTKPALYGNSEAHEHLLTLVSVVLNSSATDIEKKNMFDFAKNIFDTEIVRDSANPRQAALMAGFLTSLGGYGAAVPYYEEALKRTPRKTLLWAELSQVYSASTLDQNVKVEKAEQAARMAHTLSARSIQAATILSHVLYEQKSYGEIETVWKETIAKNKNSQESMLAEIIFYADKKDQTMLAATEERFLQIYPQFANELAETLQKKSVK